ncbi:neprilysin-2-like isoform X2 [Rhopalosiphum maidis]|nr:neprilysin-2-like isoform X2 [Rhopalosiphum maidis]
MRRTNAERNLIIFAGGMVLASTLLVLTLTMYLNVSNSCINADSHILTKNNSSIRKSRSVFEYRENEKNNTICLTPGCVIAADSIIQNMDQSVDPCDDFYQFACGNFMKHANVADDDQYTQFGTMQFHVLNKVRMILDEPIQPDEQKPFKMAKLLYKSCMDTEKIEKQGLTPIKEMLKGFGGWPVLEGNNWNDTEFTWMESMYKLRMAGFNINYFIDIYTALINDTTRTIFLDKPSLGLSREKMVESNVNEYYRYMVDIAELFGANRSESLLTELGKSLAFELKLAKISQSSEEDLNDTTKQSQMKIADLQQKFPSIPWEEYLNKLLNPFTIQQDNIITVHSPKYLSDLETLLSITPKRVQANYVFWRAIMSSVKFLTEELRMKKLNYDSEISGTTSLERWKECLYTSIFYFDHAILSMYVRRFIDENAKKNVSEITNGIREEKYKILSTIDWMDDETKKHAIDKAKLMLHHIAYPDEILDDNKLNAYYENIEFDNNTDYYTSLLKMNKFETDNIFSKLRQPVNKSDWTNYSALLSKRTSYGLVKNILKVPAGIFQDPFFSNDRPQYMNYGAIASLIGNYVNNDFMEELGKKHDKHGNYVQWWTNVTKNNYSQKEKCIVLQYYIYTNSEISAKVSDQEFLDKASSTVNAIVVMYGGLKEAYYAYNSWTKQHGVEQRLPGLQEYTPQQMFWVSAINTLCFKGGKNLDTDSSRNQIISSLFNLEDFSNDFQCPLNSGMNPVKICKVW